jgi:two-component system chemotaxis sensor kinase CheA
MRDATGPDRDRLEREFLPEAEEILEALAVHLRGLEQALAEGTPAAPLVNTIFREVHSLKGLAAMQGLGEITDLAHALEDHLERLRMGRLTLDGAALDRLHEAFDALTSLARSLTSGRTAADPAALRDRLRAGEPVPEPPVPPPEDEPSLDPRVMGALTEYEEHRLRELQRAGSPLYLVRLTFGPRDFDARLREVVQRLEGRHEIVCTVPRLGEDESEIRFDLVVAAAGGPGPLAAILQGAPAIIEALARGSAETSPPARPEEGGEELRGVSTSLRVPVARLDEVLAQVGDLAIALAAVERAAAQARESRQDDRDLREIDRGLRALRSRVRALQRGAIDARLVPVEQAFGRIGRMVARAARAAGKEVDLHTLGGDTELDKATMDELASPIIHLLRNALDHGIEPPGEREAAGKPRRGRLVLSAFPRGASAVIDVIDDGRGISLEAVRRTAEAAGLLGVGAPLSDDEAHDLIFAAGFSTAARVSQVSGRGMGLDVVRRSVRRLKGTVAVRSLPGKGTTFTLMVPITLALVQALIVRAAGERYAIPLTAVRESLRLESARLRGDAGQEIYEHASGPVPLLRLGGAREPGAAAYAVLAGPPSRPILLGVDGFLGQQEVVIKPVGRRLSDLPGVAGATDLGDATAVLVLDPEGLAAERGGHASA